MKPGDIAYYVDDSYPSANNTTVRCAAVSRVSHTGRTADLLDGRSLPNRDTHLTAEGAIAEFKDDMENQIFGFRREIKTYHEYIKTNKARMESAAAIRTDGFEQQAEEAKRQYDMFREAVDKQPKETGEWYVASTPRRFVSFTNGDRPVDPGPAAQGPTNLDIPIQWRSYTGVYPNGIDIYATTPVQPAPPLQDNDTF